MPRTRAFRDNPQPELVHASRPVQSASDKQVDFILSLLDQKDLRAGGKIQGTDEEYNAARDLLKAGVPNLSKKAASDWIGHLLEMPNLVQPKKATKSKVSDGRYALEDIEGIVHFYRVRTPDEGKWAGYTFVDIQASDDFHPIKDRTRRNSIMDEIAKDPKAAMLRYGQELGSCGHCGRTLTDETSRELGIGPVCRNKLGW